VFRCFNQPERQKSKSPRNFTPFRYPFFVRPYEELVEFIASLSPREIVEFKPSDSARDRVWDLIERRKTSSLPPDEASELDHYIEIEHLMRLAKARARQILAHGQ
jgi:hypothetical protein